MESFTCDKCRRRSSVPASTQSIRCFGCKNFISVSSIKESTTPKTETEGKINFSSYYHVNYKGIEDPRRKKKLPLISNLRTKFGLPSISSLPQSQRGRRALVCGVAYKKTKHELKGTAQDVKNMCSLLQIEFCFPQESILILSEEYGYHNPTRKNIEEGFEWLMRGIQAGDSLLFYFSGHGKRQRSFEYDDIDGFDETVCPLDFETNGMIVDSDINQAIVRPLVNGVVLHAIIDACHSGSVLDLPLVYDIQGGKWEDNCPPSGIYRGTKGGKAICISACEDYQMAADTSAKSADKEITGVMTTTFINVIKDSVKRNHNISYHELMESMHYQIKQAGQSRGFCTDLRRIFNRKILQDPQLSSSEEFNTKTGFKL